MKYNQSACVAKSGDAYLSLLPAMANRHGLIAGATGTGKTVTMKVLAESFSDLGVPVFFSDVKGDLSGMLCPGEDSDSLRARIAELCPEGFVSKAYPTRFWDLFGEKGHPVRVTVSDLGPMLLSRLLNLTEVQSGVLSIVFKVADERGLLLLDFKDLRALLQYVGDHRAEFTTMYGNVSAASIGAIQRALLAFEEEGAEDFFGEPMLDIRDWMRTDSEGRGYVNILSSARLIAAPRVYATFLLWMMSELFETLPEVGDLDKPRMIFFFDEAHLLFADAPKALVQKIVQVVKLIRSKGVGVYFVTQSPSDLPDEVLAQLSNRIQHGLRAYTPAEQTAVRAAAKAFRPNPDFKTEEALMALGTGEALVSFLDAEGVPAVVQRARILPPQSLLGAAPEQKLAAAITADEFELKYRESIDRESAYELICAAEEALRAEQQAEAEAEAAAKAKAAEEKAAAKAPAPEGKTGTKQSAAKRSDLSKTAEKAINVAANSVVRSVTTNAINSVTGGKTSSSSTIAKRAATNALNSVLRSSTNSVIRGLFGTKK